MIGASILNPTTGIVMSHKHITTYLSQCIVLMLIYSLFACSSLQKEHNQIIITPEMPMTYKGVGAASGVALMGAMGPAGIAVGVAIDQGIEKDINTTLKTKNITITSLFEAEGYQTTTNTHEKGKPHVISTEFYSMGNAEQTGFKITIKDKNSHKTTYNSLDLGIPYTNIHKIKMDAEALQALMQKTINKIVQKTDLDSNNI
jgi:hypothetical protein